MKRKLLFIALVILMLIVAATGCGTPTPVKTEASTTAPSQTVESTATPVPQGKAAEISFFSLSSEIREQYEQMIKNFEAKNPDVKVNLSVAPVGDFPQLLKTKIASGDGPDVFTLWPGLAFVVNYAKNGLLMDLSNEPWVKDIRPSSISSVTYKDKIYAQPLNINVVGVIYDKKTFKELNIEIPQTWEDFLKVCETIKAAGKIPLAMPMKTDWPAQFLPDYCFPANLVYSKNPDFDTQLLEGKVTFANSNYKKGYEMFLELFEKEYVNPNPLGVTYEQSMDMMASGECVMAVNGNWLIYFIQDAHPDYDCGMFPVPAPAGYQTTVPAGVGSCNVVYANTKQKDAALNFLAYMGTTEACKIVPAFDQTVMGISTIETHVHPALLESIIPASEKASGPFTNITWVPGIQDAFIKGYQELVAGQKTIDQMLADVDAVAVKSIAEFNKTN